MSPEGPSVAGRTDIGLNRSGNEDALLIEPPLYAVADGLGGHRAGEIASRLALDTLLAEAPKRVDAKSLGRAVRSANRAVISAAEKGENLSGMGTTLTATMVDGAHLALAHVGDSRAYLLHRGRLLQLTEDHSMVADLVRSGAITPEQARVHPQRSVITRALGSNVNMAPDVFEYDAEPGDRLLLTTDGLTTMVADEDIEEILARPDSPERAAKELVEAAKRAGGLDNITVIVLDVEATPASKLGTSRGSGESRRRLSARMLWVFAAIALAALAVWGAYAYANSRAYLVDEGGDVVVYRGVPGSFAGLTMSWRVEDTGIRTDELDPAIAARLRGGIAFAGVSDALSRVEELRGSTLPATATTPPPAPNP